MTYDLPPLTCLPAFEAAARRLSFTKAAEELCLTQAAISFQVRNLEQALSTKLFVRGHRALTLTAAGEALLPSVRTALATLAAGKASITGATFQDKIVITAPTSFSGKWLVPRLQGLNAIAPQINLLIDANDSILNLEDGATQLAIRYCEEPPNGMNAIRLMEDAIFPVCSSLSILPPGRKFQKDNLNAVTLLHDQMTDYTWSDWFKATNISNEEIQDGINFSHTGNAIDAAVAGQGIALGRLSLVAEDLKTGKLIRPFSEVGKSKYAYFLLRPPQSMKNSDVNIVTQWLVSEAAETIEFLLGS